jgi:hypothetical protein
MKETSFNELPWHDSIILEILIDRHDPGKADNVLLRVRWPDEQTSIVRFTNCYALYANMNFGIIADESVRHAEALVDSEELRVLRAKWSKAGDIVKQFKSFTIETNSTASMIVIFATSWALETVN